MLLVMSFEGLCAVRRLCSLVEASVLLGGGDGSTAAHMHRADAAAAPAILWLQSNLQALLSACFLFSSAATAKL